MGARGAGHRAAVPPGRATRPRSSGRPLSGDRPRPDQRQGVPEGRQGRGRPEEPRPGGRVLQAGRRVRPDDPAPYANALAYAEIRHRREDRRGDVGRRQPAPARLEHRPTASTTTSRRTTGCRSWRPSSRPPARTPTTSRRRIAEQTQRDLVIELLWQGNADLDLVVAEPSRLGVLGDQQADHRRRRAEGATSWSRDNDRSEIYTAARPSAGPTRSRVKQAFGKPIGGTATVKVTKFKGTPKEAVDLITVDLSNPQADRDQARRRLADGTGDRRPVRATNSAAATTGARRDQRRLWDRRRLRHGRFADVHAGRDGSSRRTCRWSARRPKPACRGSARPPTSGRRSS